AEEPERLGGFAAKRAEQYAVVAVGDLAGAVVELELLERGERPVAPLEQGEPRRGLWLQLPLALLRPAQERLRDEDGGAEGDECGERERDRSAHAWASASSSSVRRASRRCSRASGHMAIREPSRKTPPASQIRSTSGLTTTLR